MAGYSSSSLYYVRNRSGLVTDVESRSSAHTWNKIKYLKKEKSYKCSIKQFT